MHAKTLYKIMIHIFTVIIIQALTINICNAQSNNKIPVNTKVSSEGDFSGNILDFHSPDPFLLTQSNYTGQLYWTFVHNYDKFPIVSVPGQNFPSSVLFNYVGYVPNFGTIVQFKIDQQAYDLIYKSTNKILANGTVLANDQTFVWDGKVLRLLNSNEIPPPIKIKNQFSANDNIRSYEDMRNSIGFHVTNISVKTDPDDNTLSCKINGKLKTFKVVHAHSNQNDPQVEKQYFKIYHLAGVPGKLDKGNYIGININNHDDIIDILVIDTEPELMAEYKRESKPADFFYYETSPDH